MGAGHDIPWLLHPGSHTAPLSLQPVGWDNADGFLHLLAFTLIIVLGVLLVDNLESLVKDRLARMGPAGRVVAAKVLADMTRAPWYF